jgi:hypothetical protein
VGAPPARRALAWHAHGTIRHHHVLGPVRRPSDARTPLRRRS